MLQTPAKVQIGGHQRKNVEFSRRMPRVRTALSRDYDFDYDTTTIRLRRIARACFQFDASKKMNMSIFRRSHIVVESQL